MQAELCGLETYFDASLTLYIGNETATNFTLTLILYVTELSHNAGKVLDSQVGAVYLN